MNKRFVMLMLLAAISASYIHTQAPETFTTDRVHAERVREKHAHYLMDIFSLPEIKAAWGISSEVTSEVCSFHMNHINQQWDTYGCGLYIIFDKQTNEFLGLAGYHNDFIDAEQTIYPYSYTVLEKAVSSKYIVYTNHNIGNKAMAMKSQASLLALPLSSCPI